MVATLTGAAVLIGWWLDLPGVKSVFPGVVSMKPNTALAFTLAGAALVLLSPAPAPSRNVLAGRWLSMFVALAGALTMTEFMFGWDLGIDEMLFRDDPQAAATLIPGRMAPSTAVCFVLLGLALAGIDWEVRAGFRPAEALALVTGAVSAISLAEYGIGRPVLYGFSEYTRMAPHTAAVVMTLAAGVLLARPAQGVLSALRSGRVGFVELRLYGFLGVALLAVTAGGRWFYLDQEQGARDEVNANLEIIARLKSDQIARWRTERLDDAGVLMDGPLLGDAVARWMIDPQPGLADMILGRFRAAQKHNHYRDVLLVDPRGQVRLSTAGQHAALHVEARDATIAAFRERRPVLADLHVGPGELPVHLDFISPIFHGTGASPSPVAALVMTIDPRQFLYPLIQSWPTPSRSAEVVLARHEGESVVILNDLRHRADAALKLHLPLPGPELPVVAAAFGKSGVLGGVDYRGIRVVAAVGRVPDSPWLLVAKVDEAEALSEWRDRASLIVAAIAALVLALAATAVAIWQQRDKYRALSRAMADLRRANRAYRVLSECNQTLVRATGESQLLSAVCRILVEHGGYRYAWVETPEGIEAGESVPLAQAGQGPGGPPAHASSISLQIDCNGGPFGTINIQAADPDAIDPQEAGLLKEMALDIAHGIDTLRGQAARRQAEEALQQSEAELKDAQRLSGIGSWSWDLRTGRHHWSEETYCIYGRNPGLPPAAYPEVQQYFAPGSWKRLATAVENGLAQGLAYECDAQIVRADGTRGWVTVRGVPTRDAGGQVVRLHGTVQDITERKRAEEEIQMLNADLERRVAERTAQLEAANKELDAFAYSASHDLRAPLQTIDGFSRALQEDYGGKLDAEARDYLERIRAASQRMAQLVDDLLKLSRLTRADMALEPVDLGALARSIADELRARDAARDAVFDIAEDAVVQGDRHLLRVLLENLLSNAWKFTSKRARARIELAVADRNGERVYCVRDDGAGFDMAHAGKLFTPFQRLHAASEFPGNGVGLATVQRIVQRHGGRVWAESAPGKGAAFYFTLSAAPQTP